MPPLKSVANAQLVLDLLAFCKQHKIHELYASEFASMVPIFDLALHKTLLNTKCSGQTVASWFASVEDFADLILPRDDVRAVLALDRKASWSQVKDQLGGIGVTSIGRKMFEKAFKSLDDEGTSEIVRKSVERLAKSDITTDAIVEEKNSFVTSMEAKGHKVSDIFARKEIEAVYLGVPLSFWVHSYMDEWLLLLEVLIRDISVRRGDIPPLFCELELAASNLEKPLVKVEESRLEKS